MGQGAFLRLKNGALIYAYTKYVGADWGDNAEAEIFGICSFDEGETWKNERPLLRKDGDAKDAEDGVCFAIFGILFCLTIPDLRFF